MGNETCYWDGPNKKKHQCEVRARDTFSFVFSAQLGLMPLLTLHNSPVFRLLEKIPTIFLNSLYKHIAYHLLNGNLTKVSCTHEHIKADNDN